MTIDINYFRKINGTHNTINRREDVLQEGKKYMMADFENLPSYHEVLITKENTRNQGVLIVEQQSLDANTSRKKIITKPNDHIEAGEYVKWNNKFWLCIKTDLDETIQVKGIINPCNRTFTWQDQETLEILSYPCVYEDKTSPYNDGLETNKHITLADDQALITIQNNLHTKTIKLDKRIMFNNDRDNVYKITKIQDLIHDGLIYIVLSRDTYNEASDNLELDICDYKEPNNDIIIGDDYRITITGSDFVYFNREREYVATVYNGDEIVDNMDILWTLDDGNLAEIISQDGNSCVVKSGNSYGYVNLKCELVGNDDVWSSKEILIRSIM